MRFKSVRTLLATMLISAALPGAVPEHRSASLASSDISTLQAMVPAMVAAWKARDAKAYAAQFTDDAEHINAYGMWWRGRAEIEEAMGFTLGRIYPTNPISADQVSTRALAPGVAVVQYRWRLRPYGDPDGTRYEKPEGRVTQVVVEQPDGWRISHFQSTFINSKVRQIR